MANHEIVPTSAFTKGTAERKKFATSFSLPGFASSGTYSANFVITLSCLDRGHQARRPATRVSHPPKLSTFISVTVTDQLGEGTRTRMLWQYCLAWRGLAPIAKYVANDAIALLLRIDARPSQRRQYAADANWLFILCVNSRRSRYSSELGIGTRIASSAHLP